MVIFRDMILINRSIICYQKRIIFFRSDSIDNLILTNLDGIAVNFIRLMLTNIIYFDYLISVIIFIYVVYFFFWLHLYNRIILTDLDGIDVAFLIPLKPHFLLTHLDGITLFLYISV